VTLQPGTYATLWFGIESRRTLRGDETVVETSEGTSFTAPSGVPGPAVLYLKSVG
jgi:hypothetical protein